MQSKAATVREYLASLTSDRRAAIEAVLDVFRRNLDPTYAETMSYGMIGYCVPLAVYPPGYHCNPQQPLPFAGIASQKNYMSVYLMGLYMGSAEESWFVKAWKATGKKLDMGKCCIRFKKVEDLALDVIGESLQRMPAARWIGIYEAALASRGKAPRGRGAAKKPPEKAAAKATPKQANKPVTKRSAAKTPARKKAAKK